MTLGVEHLAMIAVEVCNMSVLPVNKEKDALLDKWSAQLLGSSTIKQLCLHRYGCSCAYVYPFESEALWFLMRYVFRIVH